MGTVHVQSKRPEETLRYEFDFQDFVENIGDEVPVYQLRADPGISVEADISELGIVDLTITGGVAGRGYYVGVRASAADGQSQIQQLRVRLRETRTWDDIPVIGPITDTNVLYLVDSEGRLLVDAQGRALYIPNPTP